MESASFPRKLFRTLTMQNALLWAIYMTEMMSRAGKGLEFKLPDLLPRDRGPQPCMSGPVWDNRFSHILSTDIWAKTVVTAHVWAF